MRKLAIGAAALAFAITLAWVIAKPAFDSAAAVAAAFATLVGAFFLKKEVVSSGQIQKVGDHGIGIQAGRDVVSRDINGKG